MRVLVFGASITQGYWDTEGGWVNRLRRHYDQLAVKDLNQNDKLPTIFNLGISADSSEDILERFEVESHARLKAGRQGVIIFANGTNDARQDGDQPWPGVDGYRQNMDKLITLAKNHTPKIMLVGMAPCEEEKTTPVFWRDISYTNERIKAINDVMRELASNNALIFVEVFEPLLAEMQAGRRLFADGLHPNNDGHQFLYQLVRPELDKLVNL
jgi:acyl-CoA thioesterase-1